MHINPSEGDDRRSRILTTAELQSIADIYRPAVKISHEETSTLNDPHSNYPEHKLSQLRAEIRDAKSELNDRLSRLEKRLQDQENKANNEIRAMQQQISDLATRLEKHLDQR